MLVRGSSNLFLVKRALCLSQTQRQNAALCGGARICCFAHTSATPNGALRLTRVAHELLPQLSQLRLVRGHVEALGNAGSRCTRPAQRARHLRSARQLGERAPQVRPIQRQPVQRKQDPKAQPQILLAVCDKGVSEQARCVTQQQHLARAPNTLQGQARSQTRPAAQP